MSNKIQKQDVLKGIATCSKMEHIWYNCCQPTKSFRPGIESIRKILEQLLEGSKVKVVDDCGDK